MKGFFEKYGVYLLAVVLFLALAFIYCKPVLSGKVLQSGDNINAISNTAECVRYTEQTGEHSWWTGAVFSGMPNYQMGGGQSRSDRLLGYIQRVINRGDFNNPGWVITYYFLCFFKITHSLSSLSIFAPQLGQYFMFSVYHASTCIS